MSWARWKAAEKEIAEALGGLRRVRVQYSQSIEDVFHPTLSIEVKYGKQIPRYCCVDYVISDGNWILIPFKWWGKRCPGHWKVIKKDKFIRDGISQAIKYNPDKIPLLCVKPRRYRGFIIIMRYSDYLKTSFTMSIPKPPLRLPICRDLFAAS